MAPNKLSVVLQAIIKQHRKTDKMWTYVSPVYADAAMSREISALAAMIRQKHPDVDVSCVCYRFRPGAGWAAVYERGANVRSLSTARGA